MPATMRAITYRRYGSPDVLRVEQVPVPVLGPGQMRIRVHAAEATKSDCEMRSFHFSVKWFWLPLRLAVGLFRPRRHVLGSYFAGTVDGLGPGVDRFAVGDAVFGTSDLRMGAYAEYVVVPADATLAAKPETMDFAQAAAVPLGGLNALHFMRLAAIQPGERVLILGAGGAIGGHAVQVAKHMGAHVTAVDHGRKRALVAGLGADVFIDFTQASPWSERARFDVIFDMVPSTSYGKCMRALPPGGRYLCGNPRLSIMLRCLLTSWFTDRAATFAFARERQDELEALRTLIAAGAIRPFVDSMHAMEDAAHAHRLVEREERIGTVVISMDRHGD